GETGGELQRADERPGVEHHAVDTVVPDPVLVQGDQPRAAPQEAQRPVHAFESELATQIAEDHPVGMVVVLLDAREVLPGGWRDEGRGPAATGVEDAPARQDGGSEALVAPSLEAAATEDPGDRRPRPARGVGPDPERDAAGAQMLERPGRARDRLVPH